ncbi:MAG: WYL domain-containing protein [Ferruginibacter sp.]
MKKINSADSRRDQMGIRLEILDELLGSVKRRNYRELLDILNEKLGDNGFKRIKDRTLKYDIAYLRNKYEAPIHIPDKKDDGVYYTAKFTYKNTMVDEDDILLLKKAISILKRATDIKLNSEIENIVSRLQNKIHTNVEDSYTMISFEEHTEAMGKEYFDEIFSAIQEKSTLKITYKPFGKEERQWTVHPYMLKQFRSRWFLIGRINNNSFLANIRLDSIQGKLKNSNEPFIENDLFDPKTYFNHVIGVTVPAGETPIRVQIRVNAKSADYVRTKPLHKLQEILREYKDGGFLVELNVLNNYELRSLLLSYGSGLKVIKPASLEKQMADELEKTLTLYK